VKFRRKSAPAPEESAAPAESSGQAEPRTGPFDFDELPDDGLERLDLGSLLIPPAEGLELRLQVDDDQTEVQSVLLAGPEGALELRAFAAPRGGDLWSELRPKIAAEYAQRGGTASEVEGRYGTELHCTLTVKTEDGRTGTQAFRVAGINGARWMLRATFLGRPAAQPETDGPWASALERLAVRRGSQAMASGAMLPLEMPRVQGG